MEWNASGWRCRRQGPMRNRMLVNDMMREIILNINSMVSLLFSSIFCCCSCLRLHLVLFVRNGASTILCSVWSFFFFSLLVDAPKQHHHHCYRRRRRCTGQSRSPPHYTVRISNCCFGPSDVVIHADSQTHAHNTSTAGGWMRAEKSGKHIFGFYFMRN